MSHEAMNPEQFEGYLYHGTSKVRSWKPKEITSLSARGLEHHQGTFPSDVDPEYAYATKDLSSAWMYAEKAWGTRATGIPRVFRVKPRGAVEKDPTRNVRGELRGNYEGDVRSKHGFDVVGEEEMPESMGRPEEWK